MKEFVPVYKQDVIIGVTPSEEAVVVNKPLHSTLIHWAACLICTLLCTPATSCRCFNYSIYKIPKTIPRT